MSEEEVRAVVKSCREGSCADKYLNRQGFSIIKNIVKPAEQQENKNSQLKQATTQSKAPICPKVDKTDIQTPLQTATNEPVYAVLEKLPNGCFIIKQFVMKQKNSTTDPIKLSCTPTITPINNVAVMNNMPLLQTPSVINIRANTASVNNCQIGIQSVQNAVPQILQPAIGTAHFAIPINLNLSTCPNLSINMANAISNSMIFQPETKPNSTDDSEKIDLASLDTEMMDYVSESLEKLTGVDDDEGTDSCDEDMSQSKDNEVAMVIDDQPMDEEKKSDQSDKITIEFPRFWYNKRDLKQEKDPLRKINLAIKDMRLDVLKSLRGHNASMDRLKSKIDVVTKMVGCYRVILNSHRHDTEETNV